MRTPPALACPPLRRRISRNAASGFRITRNSVSPLFLFVLELLWLIGVPAIAQGVPATGAANTAAPQPYADAVQVLAREQSAGEQYAVILDQFGKKDAARYVQGIRKYAEAKADFDGLIEALKTDLIEGRSPDKSSSSPTRCMPRPKSGSPLQPSCRTR